MHDSSQTGLAATKRQKEFESKQKCFSGDWRSNILCLKILRKLWKQQLFVFDVSNLCQKFLRNVFRLCFSKLLKIKNYCSIVNLEQVLRQKTRTKFRGGRLVRSRDILHSVSENLVSRKTRLKVSERHFSYVSFARSFYSLYSRLAVSYISQLNRIQVPWHSIHQN